MRFTSYYMYAFLLLIWIMSHANWKWKVYMWKKQTCVFVEIYRMVYLALVFCHLPFRTKKFYYLARPSTYYLSDKLAVTVKL